MNYIVLNGVKSNAVKGLMIQSLPPISKPAIRTEIETIDGKDGDIITKLGYSAYDRIVTIGLKGDYNIDDVIKFFNSDGVVTFSNEPDKYYKYSIIEQIDFERLIRFRTAAVTFHCQPFKYSTIENYCSFDNDYILFRDYTTVKGGIRIMVKDNEIYLSGTPLVAVEFYIPLSVKQLKAGSYSLKAITNGIGAAACSVRLIKSAPSDSDSFGGTQLALADNSTVSLKGTVTDNDNYNYLWLYINPKTALNFNTKVSLSNDNFNSISIKNVGNIYSKPNITLTGNGTVNLSINDTQLFVINLNEYITIYAEKMDAYKGDVLANRSVMGDYDDLRLDIGTNTISWTGNITKIEVENYSRWV